MLDFISAVRPEGRSDRILHSVFIGLTLTALMLVGSLPAYASDAWSGDRNCNSFESCRVKSYASGNQVVHRRCDPPGGSCVIKGAWSNGNTKQWRTSWHGSGYQEAYIFTTGVLSSQSATCVCVSEFCPE